MQLESKSTKGVQQEDVWAAADSLIADGLRPTIERVRQKIGRGSPNTVSPMLEAWFATLAARLGVNTLQDAPATIPKTLKEAVEDVWKMALSSGREEAEQQMSQVRTDLSQAKEILLARERYLEQQDQVRAAKHQALEQMLCAAETNVQEALTRLSQAETQTSRREVEIEGLRGRLTIVENERDSERRRTDEEAVRHAKERQRHEERAQATQHKLLEEVDRARQDAKKIYANVQILEKAIEADRSLFQQEIRVYEAELSKAQELYFLQTADLHAQQEALNVSKARSDEFRDLLVKQQAGSDSTIAQLTDALSIQLGRQSVGNRLLLRKIKRPLSIKQG